VRSPSAPARERPVGGLASRRPQHLLPCGYRGGITHPAQTSLPRRRCFDRFRFNRTTHRLPGECVWPGPSGSWWILSYGHHSNAAGRIESSAIRADDHCVERRDPTGTFAGANEAEAVAQGGIRCTVHHNPHHQSVPTGGREWLFRTAGMMVPRRHEVITVRQPVPIRRHRSR
jgi:hypothetical protein